MHVCYCYIKRGVWELFSSIHLSDFEERKGPYLMDEKAKKGALFV